MDARSLLEAGPDGYTAARDAEVRRLRAAKERDEAAALKALGRPSLALWAVLAAAEDRDLAQAAVAATSALAAAQADAAASGGAAARAVTTAAAARRAAVDAVRDGAVACLARHLDDRRAHGQRDEVRAIVDRLTRHPGLLDAWLDGTLRDVPTDTGFEAFAELVVPPRPTTDPPVAPNRRRRADDPVRAGSDRAADPSIPVGTDSAALRRRAQEVARARAAVAAAERAVADASRTRDAAQRARDEADERLQRADAEQREAEAQLAAARAAEAAAAAGRNRQD